ncbi:hypothetical protein I871_03715 [Borrelia miyamotoi LB-2001]|nr:hypothetical protein I871_03715 [Borrelia miyamotoi LB-2001]AJA58814.1 hypothetical protein RJ61_03495 [Borrelia miyamotoi]
MWGLIFLFGCFRFNVEVFVAFKYFGIYCNQILVNIYKLCFLVGGKCVFFIFIWLKAWEFDLLFF